MAPCQCGVFIWALPPDQVRWGIGIQGSFQGAVRDAGDKASHDVALSSPEQWNGGALREDHEDLPAPTFGEP